MGNRIAGSSDRKLYNPQHGSSGRTDYWELSWRESFWAEYIKHSELLSQDKIIANHFYFILL